MICPRSWRHLMMLLAFKKPSQCSQASFIPIVVGPHYDQINQSPGGWHRDTNFREGARREMLSCSHVGRKANKRQTSYLLWKSHVLSRRLVHLKQFLYFLRIRVNWEKKIIHIWKARRDRDFIYHHLNYWFPVFWSTKYAQYNKLFCKFEDIFTGVNLKL